MREIKFRAWDNGNSSDGNIPAMTQPMPLEAWISQQGFYYTNGYSAELSDFDWMNELKFMQYTGLNDKNGKEIYDGDIIKDGSRLWIIEISSTLNVKFILSQGGHIREYDDFGKHLVIEFEVIGNIYENPELVGRKRS